MDISYLIALQNFRNATGNILTPLMLLVSELVPALLIVPAVIYWCVNKRAGYYIMLNFTGSEVVNNTIKCAVCCYRPWIRDARLKPVEKAMKGATGYSFPSGHTQTAGSVLGSVGYWEWMKRRWLSIASFALAILIGFSRNYLGVHTPQDVIVALLEAAAVILINFRLLPWILSGTRRTQDGAILTGIAAAVIAVIFITFKRYPLDYAGGALLVDPYPMMTDAYGAVGDFLGFLIGVWFEKTFVNFVPGGSRREKLARFVIGVIPFGLLYVFLTPVLCSLAGDHFGTLTARFVIFFYVMAVWPAVFHWFHNRMDG